MQLTTPERFVRPLLDLATPREVIEASFVVVVASMVQCFAAIAKPRLEAEVAEMHERHGLPLGVIAGRFPNPWDLPLREAAQRGVRGGVPFFSRRVGGTEALWADGAVRVGRQWNAAFR